MMIDFNVPPFVGTELDYMRQAIENRKICGDGPFTKKCSTWLTESFHVNQAFLTTSCTHALEMAAILSEIQTGDEIILPSFTFVSTADAFVQRGAKLVFVDIRPDTMNIDESLIEDAITPRTRAIVPVHYAGVGCEMDRIMGIAKRHNLVVVEDAAQGIGSYYKDRALGTIGDYGCFSFHETKNYSMGEGGAILFNDDSKKEAAEILREKGTNRSKFFRGQINKYTWVDYGSSYLPSDLNAAYLWAQLEEYQLIFDDRMQSWKRYHKAFQTLEDDGLVDRPVIPEGCKHNAHMYYLKTEDLDTRTRLISHLKEQGILSVFHYIPLHSSPAGRKFGTFHGEDHFTTRESERLVRLPMYYQLAESDQAHIISAVFDFYGRKL